MTRRIDESSDIVRGEDGTYRWVYELNLYRNPIIIGVLFKVFAGILIALFAFSVLLSCGTHGFWWDGFFGQCRAFGIVAIVLFGITAAGYLIYAVIMGGTYCVLFEMDEEGVRHTQLAPQVKKAQAVSALTVAMGALSLNPGAVGTGLLAGTRSSMCTDFARVKRVRKIAGSNAIKLDAPLSHNQIYAQGSDLDAVFEYVRERVPSDAQMG